MVLVSLTKSTLSFKTNIQKSRFARIGFFVAKNLTLIKHLIKLSIKTKKCYNYKNITFFERKYEEKTFCIKKHLLQIVFLSIALLTCGNLAQTENTQLTSKLQ